MLFFILTWFPWSDEQHAQYLTPAFALSGVMPEDGAASSMTPEEIDAYLTEIEPDLRAADRDLQEIEALLKKGVTGSGRLPGELPFCKHKDNQGSLLHETTSILGHG